MKTDDADQQSDGDTDEIKNKVVLNPDQDAIDNGTVKLLEKYDENGNLYVYTLRETKISFAESADATNPEDVYPENSQSSNGSLITNVYNPDTGSIAIKKYLYLPEECFEANGEFPAVKFQLMQQQFNADGSLSEVWKTIKTEIWSSEDVEDAATGSTDKNNPVSTVLTFKDVPIYAPNGQKYTYKVVEVKDDFLEGYDTWAVAEDVDEDDLGKYTKEDTQDNEVEVEVTEESTTPDPEGGEDNGNTGNEDGNGVSTQTGDAGEPPDPDPEESTIKATFINKPLMIPFSLQAKKSGTTLGMLSICGRRIKTISF